MMVRTKRIINGRMISAIIPERMREKLKSKGINISEFIRQAYDAYLNEEWQYKYIINKNMFSEHNK